MRCCAVVRRLARVVLKQDISRPQDGARVRYHTEGHTGEPYLQCDKRVEATQIQQRQDHGGLRAPSMRGGGVVGHHRGGHKNVAGIQETMGLFEHLIRSKSSYGQRASSTSMHKNQRRTMDCAWLLLCV